MKNKAFLILLSALALSLAVIIGLRSAQKQAAATITIKAVQKGSTPLGLLEKYAEEKSLTLKTKVYDFGTLLEAVGSKENSKDMAWVYFVNGKAGEVAADKKILDADDIVEWKYIKPSY